MARGHPDYLTWAGRSGGGESVNTLYFIEEVAGEGEATINFPVVEAGYEHIYQSFNISCLDDAHVYPVVLYRDSDNKYMFGAAFIQGGFYSLPGFSIAAGDKIVVQINNLSGDAVEFVGDLVWTKRAI